MATRLPASQRTREELTALIEGRLSTVSAKDELVNLATRLIVEEALEGEAGDAVGRDYYEHGAQPGQGYRNGYRMGRLKTAEGAMEYSAPQIAGRDEPFRSAIREHLKGHTQGLEDLAIEMLARGLSVRDIEDAFKDENGRLLLSKTAVSQLGERLWEDYQAFAQRDLSEYEITYLFVDGIAERLRPGAKREPVLAAWGFTMEGRRVLLHMMAGSGRCRNCDSVLRGHEETRPERSTPGDLGRCSGHHQGDRNLLSTRGPPAVPCASHANWRPNCRRMSGRSWRRFARRRSIKRQAEPLRASSRPGSLPIMAASTTLRLPASRTTSKPASRTCDSRSPTAARSARRISLSVCSSRSAVASRLSPTPSASEPS